MNQNDVLIFPYVEPSNMHYCLGGVAHATWESVHGVIGNCSADPKCPNQCIAQGVVDSAVVDASGEWVVSTQAIVQLRVMNRSSLIDFIYHGAGLIL